jgi:hypothetical protein
VHHELPQRLDLDWYRKRAKELVRDRDDPQVRERIREALGVRERFRLSDAQHLLAVEHGFASWADFKRWVETREEEPPVGRIGRSPVSDYERRAEELVEAVARGEEGAVRRAEAHLPRFDGSLDLRDAKIVVAHEYGFPTWRELVHYVEKAIREHEDRPGGELGEAFDLLKASDVEGLRRLLDRKPELVRESYAGAAATLLEAMTQPEQRHVDLRVAELLIERGSELDVPLNLAACFNHVELVRLLLAAGGRVDAVEIWGVTPLQTAIYHGAKEAGDLLASVAVVPDAFYVAAGAGLLERLAGWFEGERLRPEALRLRPNLSDVGWPPAPPPRDDPRDALDEALALAAYNGRLEATELLLARGASADGEVQPGLSALRLARLAGRDDVVRLLLQRGATG